MKILKTTYRWSSASNNFDQPYLPLYPLTVLCVHLLSFSTTLIFYVNNRLICHTRFVPFLISQATLDVGDAVGAKEEVYSSLDCHAASTLPLLPTTPEDISTSVDIVEDKIDGVAKAQVLQETSREYVESEEVAALWMRSRPRVRFYTHQVRFV